MLNYQQRVLKIVFCAYGLKIAKIVKKKTIPHGSAVVSKLKFPYGYGLTIAEIVFLPYLKLKGLVSDHSDLNHTISSHKKSLSIRADRQKLPYIAHPSAESLQWICGHRAKTRFKLLIARKQNFWNLFWTNKRNPFW